MKIYFVVYVAIYMLIFLPRLPSTRKPTRELALRQVLGLQLHSAGCTSISYYVHVSYLTEPCQVN